MALALGAIALCLLTGCGGLAVHRRARLPSPRARADAAAQRFLDRYVTPDGRVQRIDQGGDTVGEGQAYGMLLAAAVGDAKRFDAIWGWTKAQPPALRRAALVPAGATVACRIPRRPPTPTSTPARALLVAACRFHRPALRQEALELGKAILRKEIASFQGAPGADRRSVGDQGRRSR